MAMTELSPEDFKQPQEMAADELASEIRYRIERLYNTQELSPGLADLLHLLTTLAAMKEAPR